MADDRTIDRDRIYAISHAARLLGISASTLRALERRGELEATRTPRGQRRFLGAELIRVREASVGVSTKKPSTVATAIVDADAQVRHAWLGSWVARAQRELPVDAPADARLRLDADLERALRTWGPTSPVSDVERLVKSLTDRARRQTEEAQEAAERREMKGQLLEHALAHLRQRIDALPRRVVGAAGGLQRQHIQAKLRGQLQSLFQKRFTGDEDWDQAGELADETLAAWYVEQRPSRISNRTKLLAAGATGLVGGVTAAAALSPDIRARAKAIRTRANTLKGPLLSLAAAVLSRLSPPPPATSPPPPPPRPAADDATTTPPSFRPGMGLGVGWLPSDWRTRYVRRATRASSKASGGSVTASDNHASDAPPANRDAAPPESPGAPSPSR